MGRVVRLVLPMSNKNVPPFPQNVQDALRVYLGSKPSAYEQKATAALVATLLLETGWVRSVVGYDVPRVEEPLRRWIGALLPAVGGRQDELEETC